MRDGIQAGRAIDSADKSFLKDHSIHGDIQVGETSYFLQHKLEVFLPQNAFIKHHRALGLDHAEHIYDCFPPDMPHTLFGGVLRYACIWTLEMVKVKCNLNLQLSHLP